MNNKDWNKKWNEKGLSIVDSIEINMECWNEVVKLRKDLKKFIKSKEEDK